jgi:hypothetical protein
MIELVIHVAALELIHSKAKLSIRKVKVVVECLLLP